MFDLLHTITFKSIKKSISFNIVHSGNDWCTTALSKHIKKMSNTTENVRQIEFVRKDLVGLASLKERTFHDNLI